MQLYMRVVIVWVSLAVTLGLGLWFFSAGSARYSLLTLAGEPFVLEVAETPIMITRGLRGRSGIADNGGLEVHLRKPAILSYSTRSTPFPIDVLYFDADDLVVAIDRLPADDPRLPGSTSPQPVMGALLLPGGTAQRLLIRPGYQIPFGRRWQRHHDGYGNFE
jgi:uncharacterized membrane protein (UPF0127 family)